MKLFRRLCCVMLCAALALPVGAGAAGSYPDLPQSHWAYKDMDNAAALGIINGLGDGRMAPEDTLSWGQYLVMLTRAFYPDAYAALIAAGASWDQAGYWAAKDKGLILEEDFLPVDPADLWAPILRQDVAVLLDRVLPKTDSRRSWSLEYTFEDWDTLDEAHQEALFNLYYADIVQGREVQVYDPDWEMYVRSREFGGQETVKRADGTVLLLRTLYEVDAREQKAVTVTLHIVDRQGNPLCDDQIVETKTGTYDHALVDENMLWHYVRISDEQRVTSYQSEYTLTYRPFTRAEAAQADFQDAVERGEASWEDYESQDFWLWFQGESYRKHLLLFGNEEQRRFPDRATAEANMVTVSVPMWRIDRKGNKVSSTGSFSIHSAIADDVVAIFTEIYNDPEQFPIHDIGGYGWRGDSATGEHNCGTAIDISPNENYQIRNGKVETGSLWQPGENPYSIPADGSVVRIFAEHGWSWGGDAWAGHSDPSEGYHDYMHFSYMGG